MTEIVVIGAGISGAATAYELARAGARIVLLDRYGPAAMASGWTLAGVRQSGRHKAELPLARAAVALWETLADELDAATGYRRHGNLRLARNEDEVRVIERLIEEQSATGLEIAALRGAQQIRDVAPAISDAVLMASYCPSDGHADPIPTVLGFVQAAERAGAVLRFGESALAIETLGGKVAGVRTDKGRIPADRVVLAAGLFGNALLEPLGLHVPLAARMVSVLQSAVMPATLDPVIGVANADVAGRQEVGGRFRVTSGSERWHGEMEEAASPVVRPTASGLARAVENFAQVVPAFGAARIEAIWAGLLDVTPDSLPVIEASPAIDGLIIAMGFSGHGFCLGPITGRILADLVQDRTPNLPIAPFALARFAGWNGPGEAATLHG